MCAGALFTVQPLLAQQISGLVARYDFNDGSLIDKVSGVACKASGVIPAADRFGNEACAYYFPGNRDSYINLGADDRLKMRVASISAWAKIGDVVHKGDGVPHNVILVTKSHSVEAFNEAYCIMYHIDMRSLNVGTAFSKDKQITLYPAGVTSMQEWHHVVMTYDDSTLQYFLDGELVGAAEKDCISTFLAGDSVMVGNRHGEINNRYFNGAIDDLMFFNRVLTPAEVKQLYKAPDPKQSKIVIRYINYALGAALFLGLIWWLIRNRVQIAVKKERERHELQNRWLEQESRVLSAQMDPHFIFNSLNTIQQFVVAGENDKAQSYLSKFARLLRTMIESNNEGSITLKEEIDLCRRYLEIESIRFNSVFDFEIICDPNLDTSKVQIPHFLIQPILENAIWHGLLPKDGDKKITMRISAVSGKVLSWEIDDNGVGRNFRKSERDVRQKKRSLALTFIAQRLEMMSRLRSAKFEMEIVDKRAGDGSSAGTSVRITMPMDVKEQEYAESSHN